MEFTKQTLKQIDNEIIEAVRAVTKKWGVEARLGGGTFSDLEATIRIKLTTTTVSGETQEQRAWKQSAELFGLKPEWLGRTVRLNGEPVTIIGLLPNRPKFCVEVRKPSGKVVLIPAPTVIRQLDSLALATAKTEQPKPTLTLVEPPKDFKINVANTVRESLPNYRADWCQHKHDKTEEEVGFRYMEAGSCTCGVRKEHVHRNDCGLITQVG